ncbi:ubiquitin carboxyl-terminal hydrolase isozyme L3 isoform X1 [Orcinus orca]|uniref:ubiquitin carboxyl-terminal hydrolase isozyme L3 isoform X1 n=1 Tax=Orcinus orca TaxID=9733 RepID=UPI0021129058|nr:ubiquitin carboxyl-terminal hydrolase isozyme L3 isoform X1 [Orcinus orca]
MDPELLSMVPRPVCAVLLLFPITEKYEIFRTEEEEKIKSQGQDVTSSVYFMKQTISNACGTIGLIHAIANNKDKMHFESGSTLKKFLEESASMSPEERARYLENYDAIRVTHETSAHEGQTEAPDTQAQRPWLMGLACEIFPDQGTNPCPLHRQADSQPLRHQGSPSLRF